MRRIEFKEVREELDKERSRRLVRLLTTGLLRYLNAQSIRGHVQRDVDFNGNLSVTTSDETGTRPEEL